jgi:hypothetical protein
MWFAVPCRRTKDLILLYVEVDLRRRDPGKVRLKDSGVSV